jgi:hypothetical protein
MPRRITDVAVCNMHRKLRVKNMANVRVFVHSTDVTYEESVLKWYKFHALR